VTPAAAAAEVASAAAVATGTAAAAVAAAAAPAAAVVEAMCVVFCGVMDGHGLGTCIVKQQQGIEHCSPSLCTLFSLC
jgi:hypothetical protein